MELCFCEIPAPSPNPFKQYILQSTMRKGEIGIGVIVVIALGLMVLIILAIMFGQTAIRAEEQTNSCQDTYRGVCTTRSACIQQGGQVVSGISCTQELTTEYSGGWQALTFPSGGATCCALR